MASNPPFTFRITTFILLALAACGFAFVSATAQSPDVTPEAPETVATKQSRPVLPPPPTWPTAKITSFYLPMRDGVGIAVDLWVPPSVSSYDASKGGAFPTENRVPLLLQATRYWREVGGANPGMTPPSRNGRMPQDLVDKGYAFAVMDVRGTGASFGTWDAPFARAEIEDIGEVVEWLSTRPWSSGKVGLFGTSYVGTTADLAASLNHPAIKCVIPRFGVFDAYGHIGVPGGVLNQWFMQAWRDFGASLDSNDVTGFAERMGVPVQQMKAVISGVKPVDGEDGAELLKAAIADHANNLDIYAALQEALEFRDGRIRGRANTSAEVSPYGWRTQYESARVPAYVWASWMDGGTAAGAIARHQTFNVPQQTIIGPWNHGGNLDCDPFEPSPSRSSSAPTDQQMASMLAFCNKHLMSIAPSTSELPAAAPLFELFEPKPGEIAYWVMGAKEWRKTKVWPPETTSTLTLYAKNGGDGRVELLESQSKEKTGSIGVIRAHESVTSGTQTRWRTQLGGSPITYRAVEWPRDYIVSASSAALRNAIEVIGSPRVKLRLVPSQEDGAVHLYLRARGPNGENAVLSEGMRRLIHGSGGAIPPYAPNNFGSDLGYFEARRRTVAPGRAIDAEITMLPVAARVPSGWHIELVIAANDHINFARYPETGASIHEIVEASLEIGGHVVDGDRLTGLASGRVFENSIMSSSDGEGKNESSAPVGVLPTTAETLETFSHGKSSSRGLAGEFDVVPLPKNFSLSASAMAVPLGDERVERAKTLRSNEALGWSERWAGRARKKLARHADFDELYRYLEESTDKSLTSSIGFLLAYMPDVDLGAMRAPYLVENARLANLAKLRAKWSDELTDALFDHYVLPYRVSQEPVDIRFIDKSARGGDSARMQDESGTQHPTHGRFWRSVLAEQLWPRVEGLSMYEAALEVNRWCWEWSGFSANSSARDQGPLTTLQRELGRCEEGVILFVCAARSVGLPARACYTPYWSVNDNNHAWVEVWADGRWWYMGPTELSRELNQVWFAGPAKRAGIVLSVAFGDVPDDAFDERVYSRMGDVTIMNSTHVYGDVCSVSTDSIEGASSEKPVTVHVHVMNFGTPRVIASFASDASVELGRGDYLLTAQTDAGPVAATASVLTSGDGLYSGKDRVARVKLTCAEFERLFNGGNTDFAWLRYPHGETPPSDVVGEVDARATNPTEGSAEYDALVKSGHRLVPELRRWADAKSRHSRSQATAARSRALDRAHVLKYHDDTDLSFQLDRAEGASPHLQEVIGALAFEQHATLGAMLKLLDDKAIWETQGIVLLSHYREFERRQYLGRNGLSDEDHRKYVCSPRIDEEPLNWLWTPRYNPWMPTDEDGKPTIGENPNATSVATEIIDRFILLNPAPHTRNGHFSTPPETLAAMGGSERAVAVLLATMLRANGIAARMAHTKRSIEFWSGAQWLPAFPFRSSEDHKVLWTTLLEANDEAPESAPRIEYQAPVEQSLSITFTQDGAPVDWPRPYAQFAVTQFIDGCFRPEWLDLKAPNNGVVATTIRHGIWYVFSTSRNRRGDAFFRSQRVELSSTGPAQVAIECGIPPAELTDAELIQRKLKLWPSETIYDNSNQSHTLEGVHAKSPTLLIMLEAASEPGRRMIDAVAQLASDAKGKGVKTLIIYSGTDARTEYQALATAAKIDKIQTYDDPTGAMRNGVNAKTLPCVVVLDADGTTRLWTEGYNPSIRGLVLAGVSRLAASATPND